MPFPVRSQLVFLTWLAAFLRLPSLFANHFHADEALFASWARLIAVWRDPLLLTQAVDKPPLLFYLQALFYPQYGAVEWAARMPNWLASLVLVPLVGVLAWRLFGDGLTAVAAATFITLNPLAVQFSATAFTDPLLTTFLISSLLFVVIAHQEVRSSEELQLPERTSLTLRLAGLFFSLAVVTKYQAWLFLPLLGVFSVARPGAKGGASAVKGWLRGFLPIMLLLLLWTIARQGSPGLVSTQLRNYGGLQFIETQLIWATILEWMALFQLALGGWVGTIILVASLFFIFPTGSQAGGGSGFLRGTHFLSVHIPNELVLILFIVGYLLIHLFLGIPAWSRYLLPIMPLVALLFGRGMGKGWHLLPNPRKSALIRGKTILVLGVILLQGQIAWQARNGRFPIGGQPNADHGAHQIAAYLIDAPYGTVLYDHWYSWTWRYYFFDKGVYVSWFPDEADLIDNLQVFGEQEGMRYIALPETAVALPVQQAITQAGFRLETVMRTDSDPGIVLYRVEKDSH